MSLSLRDQLLQAGLLNLNKAKQAGKEQHQQRREQAKRPPSAPDPRALAEQRAAEAKAARDLELNRALQEKQEQKARRAQIKQLVEQHRVAKPADGEELYNFIDGRKIRRIPVDRPMREKLVSGQLAIVRSEGRYEIVPSDTADRVRERDPHAVVSHNTAKPAVDENDPYKDHVVPDDLMW
ncbi:MAG: DUF2058 domain-containing protein [Panacagrimonas sp.]